MGTVGLLTVQFTGVVVLVLLLWVLGRRRVGFAWSSLGWGALAFPLSQVARLALTIPLNLLLSTVLPPAAAVTATTVVMLATSGLFEESTRWIVMRYWAKRVRTWDEGIGFGLGHGGIEALLLLGIAAVNNFFLAINPDMLKAQVEAAGDPEALNALNEQLTALNELSLTFVAMSWYERLLAISLHVALSVLIMRGVRERRWQLWLIAVIAHVAFNSLVLLKEPLGHAGMYALLTVPALIAVWAVVAGPLSRRADALRADSEVR